MEKYTEDALKKLNVAGLKAIAKERQLVGVSKLPKAEFVQRLLDHQNGVEPVKKPKPPVDPEKEAARKTKRAAAKAAKDAASAEQPTSTKKTASREQPIGQPGPNAKPAGNKPTTTNTQPKVQSKATSTSQTQPEAQPLKTSNIAKPEPSPEPRVTQSSEDKIVLPSNSSSVPPVVLVPPIDRTPLAPIPPVAATAVPRQVSMLSGPSIATDGSQCSLSSAPLTDLPPSKPTLPNPPSVKKRKVQRQENDPPAAKKTKLASTPCKKTQSNPPFQPSAAQSPDVVSSSSLSSLPVILHPPERKPLTTNAKRFIPPVIKKPALPLSSTDLQQTFSQQGRSQIHLDFSDTLPVSLDAVSLPPTLSHRKFVIPYALILSQVHESDLKSCVLVSKMFRYAVYISAGFRLCHDFAGYRLDQIMLTYSPNMTDMWPYLRQRQQELALRQSMYQHSFLNEAFRGKVMISPHLWTSPDHDKQITVAVRFLLTRLFFSVSVGQSSDWLSGQIIDCQPLVQGEIWSIKMQHNLFSTETFYVLEATCEVVGRTDSMPLFDASQRIPVRADWSEYISDRMLPPSHHTLTPPALMEHVAWTNHEEFDRGISRHWLKRVRREGSFGAVKETIAERYIFACIVDNSVSGRWMSATQMAQDFAGVDIVAGRHSTQKVSLFLPSHHHVESVHFKTPSGAALHPALAIIQTPSREYYVLKDNGMQVGTEEDGVAEVWMNMLRCANNGESV